MALAQFADRYVAALVAWVWVRNTGVPETDGSFAAAVLLIEPLEAMAACSTGRAPPSSHRFCPPVAACEERNSSHSRAAAGCDAVLLMACAWYPPTAAPGRTKPFQVDTPP